MSKNFISRAFDAVLEAKLAAERKMRATGRAWGEDTATKQALINKGKFRLD